MLLNASKNRLRKVYRISNRIILIAEVLAYKQQQDDRL